MEITIAKYVRNPKTALTAPFRWTSQELTKVATVAQFAAPQAGERRRRRRMKRRRRRKRKRRRGEGGEVEATVLD